MTEPTGAPAPGSSTLTFEVVHPDSQIGRDGVRRFFADIVGRYWGREATTDEVDRAMVDEPSSDLAGETGFFVVVRGSGEIIGCGGVRVVSSGVGELTRIFVDPVARGRGAARALLGELERLSALADLRTLRLTVREDLAEARRLYEGAGYRPVAAFSDSPYADHFLAKEL